MDWLRIGPPSYHRAIYQDVARIIDSESPHAVAQAIISAAMAYVRAAARDQIRAGAGASQRYEDAMRAELGLPPLRRQKPVVSDDEPPIAERHLEIIDALPDLSAFFAIADNFKALRRQGERSRWAAVKEWRERGASLMGLPTR